MSPRTSSKKRQARSLLKFSSYSTAIVLPKPFLEQLAWEVGDQIEIVLKDKSHELILSKTPQSIVDKTAVKPIAPPPAIRDQRAKNTTRRLNYQDDVMPIPEIE